MQKAVSIRCISLSLPITLPRPETKCRFTIRKYRFLKIVSRIYIIFNTFSQICTLSESGKRGLAKPAARYLEQGRLGLSSGVDIPVNVNSDGKIGRLARIFEEIIHRLRSYVGEIDSVLDSIAGGDLTNGGRCCKTPFWGIRYRPPPILSIRSV